MKWTVVLLGECETCGGTGKGPDPQAASRGSTQLARHLLPLCKECKGEPRQPRECDLAELKRLLDGV